VGEKKRGKRRAQLTASFSIEHLQLSWFEGGLRYVIDLPQYTVNVYEFSEKNSSCFELGREPWRRERRWTLPTMQKDYDHIQDIKDSQEANDRPAAQEAPTSSEKQEKFRWLDADAAEEFGSPTSEQVRETPKTSTTTTREYSSSSSCPPSPTEAHSPTQQIILPLTFDSIQEDEADEINTSLSDLVGSEYVLRRIVGDVFLARDTSFNQGANLRRNPSRMRLLRRPTGRCRAEPRPPHRRGDGC